MASFGKSEKKCVVTKTVQTVGPDGKVQTKTIKEETKVISKGDSTTKTTVTTSDGQDGHCAKTSRKPLFGGFFGEDKGKTKVEKEAKKQDTSSSDEVTGTTSMFSALSLGNTTPPAAGVKGQNQTKPKVSLDEFRKQALNKHNEYRAAHGAAALKLSSQLNSYAQSWAEQMGKTKGFAHRPDRRYGENIFYAMDTAGISADDVVSSWYNEIKRYNFRSPGFRSGTGHFTQVVWKGSSELGVGMCEPSPGLYFVVANYNPAGNIGNQYEANVLPRKG